MILDKVPMETEESFDMFSFAGRVALLGGTAYAGYKTYNDFNAIDDFAAGPMSNPFNKKVTKTFRKFAKKNNLHKGFKRDVEESLGLGFKFGQNVPLESTRRFTRQNVALDSPGALASKLDALRKFTGTGARNFDSESADLLQKLVDKYGSRMNVSFMMNDAGDVGAIDLSFGEGKRLRLNPTSSLGQAYGGKSLDTVYSVASFLKTTEDGDPRVLSTASYALDELINAKDIDKFDFTELKQNLDKLKQYDSDERAIIGSFARSPEDLSSIQVRKAGQVIPNPKMNLKNRAALEALRQKMGGVLGTENNTAKGAFYVDTETRFTPVKTLPGMEESINSAQIHRTVKMTDMEGLPDINENVQWGKETMKSGKVIDANNNLMKMNVLTIADPEKQKAFVDELLKMGVPIEQLTDEGMIIDEAIRGKIISGSGSLNLAADELGETTESLLKMVAAEQGISIEELARRAAAGEVDASYFKNVDFDKAFEVMFAAEKNELELLERSRRLAKAGKEKKKAEEYSKLITQQKLKIKEIKKQARILGKSPDGRSVQMFTQRLKGATIQGMSFDPDNNQVKFVFNRISESIAKLKLYSGEGNLKKEIEYAAKINEAAKNAGIDLQGRTIQAVSFSHGIETNPQKLSRAAGQTIVSMSEQLFSKTDLTDADKRAIGVMESMGIKRGAAINAADMEGFDWRKLYLGVGEAYLGSDGISDDQKIMKAISMARAGDDAVYVSTHLFGLGESKLDLGVGKTGSLSSRQLFGLVSMGLDEFVGDLMDRRSDKGQAIAQINEFRKIRELENAKGALVMSHDSEAIDLLRAMFQPDGKSQTYEDFMTRRSNIFKKLEKAGYGKDGRIVFDLGREFNNKKIVISNSGVMSDYIGIKHGTYGDKKSLTTLDFVISKLLNGSMNKDVMQNWIDRYDKEMAVIEENFNKSLGKSKIDESLYGKFEGFKQGMSDYIKKEGIKGNVIFMNDDDILEMFDQKALARARKGQLFGMVGREPAESIYSSAPTRIVSTSVLGEEVAQAIMKNSNRGTIFTDMDASLLKAMFGDYDGDKGVVMPYLGNGGQLKDFVSMNRKTKAGQRGAAFFAYQETLAKGAAILKGRGGISDLDMGKEVKILFNEMAARMGKGNIGDFSNRMSQIHAALRADLFNSGGFMKSNKAEKFMRAEATTHMLIENIIKAKHMSLADMTDEKAVEIMSYLTGDGINKNARDVSFRAAQIEEFFDKMVFGDLYETFNNLDEAVRHDSSATKKMLVAAMTGEGVGPEEMKAAAAKVDEMLNFKKIFANAKNLEYIVEMADAGKRLGKTTDELGAISEMLYQTLKKGGSIDDLQAAELMDLKKTNAKNIAKTFMKNFGVSALLPAAGIGLIGSVLGGPGETKISSNSPESIKANNSSRYQMSNAPRYREAHVSGSMNAGSQQFLNIMNQQYGQGNIHIADHRANMDKYAIDELVQRGY